MLGVASAENPSPCKDNYWITTHEQADCSDSGFPIEMPLKLYFESFISNTCESMGEGLDTYKQSQCDDKGMHLITFSDAECKTETERKSVFEWNKCDTEAKITIAQTKPEVKEDASGDNAQIGELVDCPANLWVTTHQTDDCSDAGFTVKMPEDQKQLMFAMVGGPDCQEVLANVQYMKIACDATGLWAATFSDKECTKVGSGKRAFKWGACDDKTTVHASDPSAKAEATTDAFSTKAALGSLVLGFAALMN